MKCPFCSFIVTEGDKRCQKCGKSLITRVCNSETKVEEEVPYYIQTEAQQKRTAFVSNVIIGIISTVVIGILGTLLVFRFKPSLFIKSNPSDVKILASVYEVVQMDENYYNAHGTTTKVVIPFTIVNNRKRPVTLLTAKVYASSKDMQIWSSTGVVDEFTFIKPDLPLGPDETRVVNAEFPITYNPSMSAKIRWDYGILKIE